MAKEATTTHPGPWDVEGPMATFGARVAAQQEALGALIEQTASLPEGTIVGGLIRFRVADGFAFYIVTSDRPLVLTHVPFLDAYRIPAAHMRGLNRSDVADLVRSEQAVAALFVGSRRAS